MHLYEVLFTVMSVLQMRAPEDGEDSEEDFVDVPEKEGYEPHIPEHLRAEYGEFVQVHNP